MKDRKNKTILIKVFFAVLLSIIIYSLFNVRNKTFMHLEDIIYYSALPDGTENLYGLTDTGKIYCFNNKKAKVEVILEESDIIFLEVEDVA